MVKAEQAAVGLRSDVRVVYEFCERAAATSGRGHYAKSRNPLDAGIALTAPKPLSQIVEEETSSGGIINFIFVSSAGLALLLAAAGLYGACGWHWAPRQVKSDRWCWAKG